ncbi:hypothetical protein AAVH_16012 [Aphelenchoides avenae]|nr:hypothetical protein AAVH_38928 [Aphelenchus avenae]KAH7716573.1 hypothetical protein AAVH_16012 [Aphelenchus avenae]
MSLCCGRRKNAHKSAFVKSSALRWIVGDLRFNDSLPRPDFVHRLIEHFRESTSPWSMRRVVFSPDEILCEYISASCQLPGVYVEFFPCPHCMHTEEEDDEWEVYFVEVFHVPNVRKPDVCATLTFTTNRRQQPYELPGCSVAVEVTKGCPNAPMAVNHSPRVALHIHTDGFIEVFCFLTRSELETALLVSRRWSNVVGWAEGTLQQR